MKESRPVTAIIVGAGNRAMIYASYALEHPDELKIVGVVEPDALRRKRAAELHHVSEEQCYASQADLLARGKQADAVINGTMDTVHVETTLPLLQAGYDVLLEKPIGISEEEVMTLLDTARACGRKVMICHVLRYAPFYAEIKQRVEAGEIGDLISIQTEENVSYHHMSVAYVRGKWNRQDRGGSSMLMAKSCHDLDILTWMKKGNAPVKVSSFGSRMFFREDKAPEGAGKRCLADCQIEESCPYSARKHYIDQDRWHHYAWRHIQHIANPSTEDKLDSLRTDNPFGRCVWHCDNEVVDHQTVLVEFEDGCTAAHSMVGGTSKPCRTIHLIGTTGEIYGVMEDGYYVVRHPDARAGHEYVEKRVDLDVSSDMHGGGDLRLVADFVSVMRGVAPSISTTSLEDSIYGHLIGFRADQSRLEERVLRIERLI